MESFFNSGGMIPIFPEGSLAFFPLVLFLRGPSSDQLDRFWNDLWIFFSHNQKVDVI